jgi:DNA invertase Pin-like site-specific DNA recombinase
LDGVVGANTRRALDAVSSTSDLTEGVGMGMRPSVRVRHLQRMLERRGFDVGPPGADGRFGPLTADAVRRMQRVGGLADDGVVDTKTRLRLIATSGRQKSSAQTRPQHRERASRDVRQARPSKPQAASAHPVTVGPGSDTRAAQAAEIGRGEQQAPTVAMVLGATAMILAGAAMVLTLRRTRARRQPPAVVLPPHAPVKRSGGATARTRSDDRPERQGRNRVGAAARARRERVRGESGARSPVLVLAGASARGDAATLANDNGSGLTALDKTKAPREDSLDVTVRPDSRRSLTRDGNARGSAGTEYPAGDRPSPPPAEAKAVIGYVTVSAEAPETADKAAAAIRAACDRAGWQLLEVVRDRDNGLRSLKRPGLCYALGKITSGDARALVVNDLDRLSRSMVDLGTLMQWFRDANAALVALDLDLDTSTAEGSRVAEVLSKLSEREREHIARRTRAGLADVKARGGTVGRPAVSDRPELRQYIAALRAQNMTLQAIADKLNAAGVATLRGGALWRPSSVQAALGYRRPPRHASAAAEIHMPDRDDEPGRTETPA